MIPNSSNIQIKNLPQGWIGVDLDGTLAEYDHWIGVDHIGKPILPMVTRVRTWLSQGRDVRIFTARMGPQIAENDINLAKQTINKWCIEQFGTILPVTATKDFQMIELWDDRCVQVEPNTGRRMDGVRDV